MPVITVANGTTLAYETFGPANGKPLVLIEGLTAQMIKWRVEYCELLVAAGFYVIRFDNRDVGQSQKFPEETYFLSDMAEDTIGLIEALDLAPCHIMGQSMGGMIAQIVAATRPELVASLDLVYTTASVRFLLAPAADRDITSGRSTPSRDDAIEEYVAGEYVCRSAAYPQDLDFLREIGGQAFDRDPLKAGNARQSYAVFNSPDRAELAARITAPTLILAGDSDLLIDFHASEELHELIPGSTLRIFPGMGHEIPQPLWAEVIAAVTDKAAQADLRDRKAHV
ncbi:MAG: alpha/beta hydrolase [Rhodoglobus sp.]